MSKAMQSKRVITFVPAYQAHEFAKTIAADIPHLFGSYDSVCWWSEPLVEQGTEQYRPLQGQLQQTPSVRMEFSIPDDTDAVDAFIKKLNKHHPWQEPVILIQDTEIIK